MTTVADIFMILPLFAKLSPSLNSSKIGTTHPQRKVRNLSNCSQLVHDLFKTCSWLVQNLFMTCSWNVHTCSPLVHDLKLFMLVNDLSTPCLKLGCDLLTACSLLDHDLFWLVHELFMKCSWLVYDLLMTCSWLDYDLFMTYLRLEIIHDLFIHYHI